MSTKLEKKTPLLRASRPLAAYVSVDPGRLGGEPVFRGTRVPVKSLFDHLKAGDTIEVFLDDFPGVTRKQVEGVLELSEMSILDDALGR